MGNRSTLPRGLEKAVFQQFSSRCAFCNENNVSALQVHHIEPYANTRSHEIENLILVCANCHGRIEAGDIPRAAVYRRKMQALSSDPAASQPTGNTVTVKDSKNFGIIANQVNIKASARNRVPVSAPDGTIASHRDSRNYVKYLINRYHEYKRAEIGAGAMKYAVFYGAIERKFGAKWDHVPLERFEQLVEFVQRRIDGTVLGKTRKANGAPRYRTFGDYLDKYGP